jgi:hypothetical protein
MIQANELRLGNWVMEAGEPSLIYSIESGGITFFSINNIAVHKETLRTLDGHEKRFEPIPLTHELLEACGFEGVEQNSGANDFFRLPKGSNGIANWIEYDSDGLLCFHHGGFVRGVPVRHLHQLQNLYFALTGSELPVALQQVANEGKP